MAPTTKATMDALPLPTRRVEANLHLARGIVSRLDSNEALSRILPALKDLFARVGDEKHEQLIRYEMYGLKPPTIERSSDEDRSRAQALELFLKLHAMADPKALAELTADGDLRKAARTSLERPLITANSIEKIERNIESWPENERRLRESEYLDGWTENTAAAGEQHEVLNRVRMYLAERARAVLVILEAEAENQRLIGPDYRIVLEWVAALDTAVGDKLRAALRALHSENPEDWSLAALACRNVVLALGRSLWLVPLTSYDSAIAGHLLDLTGEKEKNCLRAYIDQHHQAAATEDDRERLKECDLLTDRIYGKGSQGKRSVLHREAQILVVDTFKLIEELRDLTDLAPMAELLQ